jgi:hypothetical protein
MYAGFVRRKTREASSRYCHKFQLPKDNQLKTPNERHVENSVVLQKVKKFPASVVKLGNKTVISDDVVYSRDVSTHCIKTPHHKIS